MIKAVSALTREYNDALRKYCVSKKPVILKAAKEWLPLLMVAVVCVLVYLMDKKPPVVAPVFIVFFVILKTNDIIKSRKARNDIPRVIYDITVDGNKFVADSKRDVKDSTVKNTLHYEIDCDKLISAKEGGGFFFIETEPGAYIIIKQNDICEGTSEELRQILKDSLGEKYKVINK